MVAGTIIYALINSFILALMSIGFNLTFGISGVANFAYGAFYVLANARRYTDDSLKFVMEMLEAVQVGVAPGIDFGANGEGYLRFSYATSLEDIEKGCSRIRAAVGQLG